MMREFALVVAFCVLGSSSASNAQTSQTPVGSAADANAGSTTAGEAASEPSSAGRTADAAARDDEAAEDEERRRNRHFWIDLAVGYSYINLIRLDQDNFVPSANAESSSGIIFEGGLGFDISLLRIGVAGSYARYSGYDVGTAELDLALVIPTPIIEPYIEAGIGYGWIDNVDVSSGSTTVTAPIHGIAIDVGLGLDLHISDAVQLGVGVDASFLNLQRQKVTELGTITNVDFTQTGNALGIQINGTGRITFQF